MNLRNWASESLGCPAKKRIKYTTFFGHFSEKFWIENYWFCRQFGKKYGIPSPL